MSLEKLDSALHGNAQTLCALLDGMHAAVQPLTVLRCRLDEQSVEDLDAGELRRTVLACVPAVERLEGLLGSMQRLIATVQASPKLTPGNPVELIRSVAEGLSLFFDDAGIELHVNLQRSRGKGGKLLLMDPAGLEQALVGALLMAHGLSGAGDRVTISAAWQSEGFRAGVRCSAHPPPRMTPEHQLQLALTDALLSGQGGSSAWNPLTQELLFLLRERSA